MPLFFLVVALIVALAHVYFWRRLVRDPKWLGRRRRGLAVLLAALAAAAIAGISVSRWTGPERARPISWVGGAWAGTTFILLVLLFTADLFRGLAWLARRATRSAPVDPGRRQFLARALAGGVGVAGAGLSAVAAAAAARRPEIAHVEVALDRLPPPFDGFRIVQLSDMHVGPLRGREFVADVVERTNELAPDVVAITGDLADASVEDVSGMLAPLADLRARHGVFFTTGNHEYFWGVDALLDLLARLHVRALRNERVAIERAGSAIDLAGVDDASAARYGNGHGADLEKALSGRDESVAVVLLAHQPKQVFDARRRSVDLVLSGHTHGGQIAPFGFFVRLVQPAVRGLHRFGDTQLYVSCGTGTWGPPMRLGSTSEITLVELRRTPAGSEGPR